MLRPAGCLTCWLVAWLVVTLGCGEQPDPYGPVNGTVTFQGQPVANALMVFEHVPSELSVTTEANEAGQYEARRSANMPGLPPGEYRVAVKPPMFYPGIGGAAKKPPTRPDIPGRYRDVTTSGLTFTVTEQRANEFDIDMQP